MNCVQFSFGKEKKGEAWVFLLRVTAGSRRLDFASLREFAKGCEKKMALVRLIGKEIGKGGIALDATNCHELVIKQPWELAEALAKAKLLVWGGKEIFLDPLGLFRVSFELEDDGNTLQIRGFFLFASRKIPMGGPHFFFPGSGFAIADGVARQIDPAVHMKWLGFLPEGERSFTGKEREKWIDLFEDGAFPGSPQVVWGKRVEKEEEIPLPILALTDRTGGFANLLMEYGEKRVPFSRDLPVEKMWEEELLEGAFTRKQVGSSSYYCPLDQVVAAMTRLLEKGWRVVDAQGREVVRQEKLSALELRLERESIALVGKVAFAEEELEIERVLSSLAKREHFLSLGDGRIALVDRAKVQEQLGDATEELISGKGKVPKVRFGLFGSLLSKTGVKAAPDFAPLAQFLREGKSREPFPLGESFVGSLHPYQKEGVEWLSFLSQMGLHGLLADEMGLGKTVQVLAFLSSLPSSSVLIVAPTSLLFNWKKEIEKFLPGREVHVHTGAERLREREELAEKEILLTSYALLRRDALLLQKIPFDFIVLDEAQTIKNPDSQIAVCARELQGKMRICLSGTPVENRPDDLWSLFAFLLPGLLGDRKAFAREVEMAKRVEKKIAPFLLRRTKQVIADQLPPLLEQVVWVEMSDAQRQCYEELLEARKIALFEKDQVACKLEILEAILRLRQICAHPVLVKEEWEERGSGKWERVLSDLEEIVASGEKVLVYSGFVEMLSLIREALIEKKISFAYLDGQTRDREEAVRSFREEEGIQVFLISLKAGGVGLNLPEADYVLLLDPWWNDAVERQAIDRAHRLGRKGRVIARRYVTAASIEEKMMLLKEAKGKMIEQILEGSYSGDVDLDAELFAALLQ